MEEQIFTLLNYINKNGKIPKCEEINVSQERLVALIRKCNNDNLLDKNYIFVNILGNIQSDSNADLGITSFGYDFLKNNNPIGEVKYN